MEEREHLELSSQIVNIDEYDLTGSAGAHRTAIAALAHRTEAEGHPGVLHYQFYVNESEGTAGATIGYADAAAWVAHHQMAYQWGLIAALQATVALERPTVLGPSMTRSGSGSPTSTSPSTTTTH